MRNLIHSKEKYESFKGQVRLTLMTSWSEWHTWSKMATFHVCKFKNVLRSFNQDGVTGTRLTLWPETNKNVRQNISSDYFHNIGQQETEHSNP